MSKKDIESFVGVKVTYIKAESIAIYTYVTMSRYIIYYMYNLQHNCL